MIKQSLWYLWMYDRYNLHLPSFRKRHNMVVFETRHPIFSNCLRDFLCIKFFHYLTKHSPSLLLIVFRRHSLLMMNIANIGYAICMEFIPSLLHATFLTKKWSFFLEHDLKCVIHTNVLPSKWYFDISLLYLLIFCHNQTVLVKCFSSQ